MRQWIRGFAVATSGLVGLLFSVVGVVLLPGNTLQGHGQAALVCLVIGVVLCVAVVLVAVLVVLGVRHLTGREIPSQRSAEASVATGYHVEPGEVRCVRVNEQYWDYSCTWFNGGRQHDWFRFEGARIADEDRMWG